MPAQNRYSLDPPLRELHIKRTGVVWRPRGPKRMDALGMNSPRMHRHGRAAKKSPARAGRAPPGELQFLQILTATSIPLPYCGVFESNLIYRPETQRKNPRRGPWSKVKHESSLYNRYM